MGVDLSHFNEEALAIFESKKVQDNIKNMYRKISKFSPVVELDDCLNSAFESILIALKDYNTYRNKTQSDICQDSNLQEIISHGFGNGNAMILDTFVFWYLKKGIYNLVGGNSEIEWHVWDQDGEHVKTLNNDEYRKQKVSLQKKGFKFSSINLLVNLSTKTKNDDDDREYEPIDMVMRGFEDESHDSEEHFRKIRR